MRKTLSVFVVLFLLTSQMAVGQTAAPSNVSHYRKLFGMSSGLTTQTRNICKTEACTKAADELDAVIADGQDKHKRGILVEETRKQWHADYEAAMKKLRSALIEALPETTKKAIANRQSAQQMQIRPVQGTEEECALCDEVLVQTSAICIIYELWCPICTLICLSTAAIAYGRCELDYCPSPNGTPGPNCPPAILGCP